MPELKQVVLVGAGLDMRPYRLKDSLPNVRYFELDLPVMLAERQRVIAKLSTTTESERVQLAANFHVDAVDDVLRQCEQFDASLPTAFIYEGCAMYFDEESNVAMLSRLASLMQHPASRLWVDFVSHDAVSGGSGQPAVNEFLGRMADMGEAFVFGLDNPYALLDQCGLMPTSIQSSLDYLNVYGQPDAAIYDLYSFTVAKAK
jgi:methyltransferase (TIGR00027 family)